MRQEIFRKGIDSCILAHDNFSVEEFSPFKGECFWKLEDLETGEVQTGHIHNIVTRDASILIARLMKGTGTSIAHECEPNFGSFALGVGTGDVGWNLQAPPTATNTQRSLYNELARKTFSSTNFVKSDGTVSGIPTNVIDLTTVFSISEAVGPIVEMGILGGDISTNMATTNPVLPANGIYDPTTDVTGRDCLVNYVTFPVINKSATSQLGWTWRYSFLD